MTRVGSYQAKTHLAELLKRVAKGEQILITKRGKPVALLAPAFEEAARDIPEVIRQLKELRRGNALGKDLSVKALIEEGRRF
jgi:prevent-host-death family protein